MKRTYIYTIITTIVALSLLQSCQLGRQYTRPNLHLPTTIDTLNHDSASIADVPWEEVYRDPTLQNMIRKTLENNKDVKIAAAKVKELAEMKRIDLANLFPKVGLSTYMEKEGLDEGGDKYSNSNKFYMKASVIWELDLWGNLRWAKDKSMADFLASIENQRALKMSMIAQMAQSYYELVSLDNELSIVRKTAEARRKGLHLAHIRYIGGLTNETPYRQAQVELARTMTLLPDLEKKVAMKHNEIAFMMGEYPHQIEHPALQSNINLPDSLPVGLPSTLLERRPDVRKAEQALIAANASVGMAFTNLFPRLSLTASGGSESKELENMFKSPYHLISGSLINPIFNAGKNRAQLKAKKAAYEQALYEYEKKVLNAFKEASNAIIEFNKSRDIYESRLHLESASKSSLELANLQYINGVIAYLDLLDAQRSYFDAQIGLSNSIRDKQIAIVRLYKALGGGWTE